MTTEAERADPLEEGRPRELKRISYELFMLLVSTLTIVNLVLWVLPIEGPIDEVSLSVATLLIPLFVLDFLYRLLTAPSRLAYLVRGWGWADFLSAVPFLGIFRIFRIVRVARLLRAMDNHAIVEELYVDRASTTFLGTMFLVLLVTEFAGTAVFYFEAPDPEANIRSGSDAVWWGLVTITTVGYGDQFPVTNAGRIVGTVLLFSGIALFSVLTGYIANVFLSPSRTPRRRIKERLRGAEGQIADLRALLAQQDARTAEIRARLDDLERTIRAPRPRTTGPADGAPATPRDEER